MSTLTEPRVTVDFVKKGDFRESDITLNNHLFQDVTVEATQSRGNGLVSEYEQPTHELRDDMSDTIQPLDFSITSKMLERTVFQHPSLDDLPELKPCPIVAAENAKCQSYLEEAVNLTIHKEDKISPKKERKRLKRKRKENKLDMEDICKEQSLPNADLPVVPPIVIKTETLLRLDEGPQVVPSNGELERAPQTPPPDLSTTPPVLPLNENQIESPPPSKALRRPGRRPGQPSRVYHLWEFLRDLLLNETYCPSHIHWIDKLNGVFRIAKSEDVAKLWGQRKRTKRNMTYEKMSRAIRFSRAAGYFGNLPKDGDYPKKLCFKFGPRCQDWIVQSASEDIPIRAPREETKVPKTSKTSQNDKKFPLKKRKYNFTT